MEKENCNEKKKYTKIGDKVYEKLGHGIFKNVEDSKDYLVRIKYKDSLGKKHEHKAHLSSLRKAEKYKRDFLSGENNNFSTDITFSELYEKYLAYKKARNKMSTYVTDKSKIDSQIIPRFGNRKVKDIKVYDIGNWHTDLLNEGELSIGYIKNIHQLLSRILKFGVKNGYITTNVAAEYGNLDVEAEKKEMQYFTKKEWDKFNSVLDDSDQSLALRFMYYTGVRKGECLALRYRNFNNDFESVTIKYSVSNKTGGEPTKSGLSVEIDDVKTRKSRRTIKLPKVLRDRMIKHYNEVKKYEGFNENKFVFGFDKPISSTGLKRKKDEKCREAGVKQIRIHDLRHSHASFLINSGANILAVADRMGHADSQITLSTYAHFFKEDKETELINLMDSLEGENSNERIK